MREWRRSSLEVTAKFHRVTDEGNSSDEVVIAWASSQIDDLKLHV